MFRNKKIFLSIAVLLLLAGLGHAWMTSRLGDRAPDVVTTDTRQPDSLPESVAYTSPEPVATGGPPTPTDRQAGGSLVPGRLEGRIVDADGNGLAGINIRIRTSRRSEYGFILRQDLTDASGEFALTGLDKHATYLLFTDAIADYPGYRLDGFTLDKLPRPFEIRLHRLVLVDIRGTVVDTEHAPIAGFIFTVESVASTYPPRTIISDASGSFRLEDFPVGELKAYTAEPDYFRIQGLHANVDDYSNLTLVIDYGRYRLAGRVVDENGAPIESARITLSSELRGNEFRSRASRTRLTDASGRFEFTGLGGIPHTLGIYATGYSPRTEQHLFQSFSDQVEIRL